MASDQISPVFLQHACDVLADTQLGLTGSTIVKATVAYALMYDVNLPHPTYPFGSINKRTALYENLMAFSPPQQYLIIRELCDHPSFASTSDSSLRSKLKINLIQKYHTLASPRDEQEINAPLIEQTRHWLSGYPEVISLYNEALQKYDHGAFSRNLLDDLRLSLEKLLKQLFQNDKSLENQMSAIGDFIAVKGGSRELSNMFVKLVDYYSKYQNSYVKHDDNVIEDEIEFVIEISSSFMKHLIKLSIKD